MRKTARRSVSRVRLSGADHMHDRRDWVDDCQLASRAMIFTPRLNAPKTGTRSLNQLLFTAIEMKPVVAQSDRSFFRRIFTEMKRRREYRNELKRLCKIGPHMIADIWTYT